MQFEFFQKQVERLRNVYSAASLNNERVQVMWDSFKHIEPQRFENAVNHLIGEFTTPALPAISKFREAIMLSAGGGHEGESKFDKWDRENPVQPIELRRKWAREYGGSIQAMLRGIGRELPYDPTKSVAEEDGVEW